jgi:GBP family porin
MRKIGAALAAATVGLAGSAHAQQASTANVQLYGRLDLSANAIKYSGGPNRQTLSSDTSLFGFRGVEDLGGGLSAYFKLESGISPDLGAQGNATRLFNRESLVGLRDERFGAIQLGSQWTPILWLSSATDPFGRAMTGAQFTLFQGLAARGYTNQFSNAVQYITPKLAGFTGRLMVSAPEGTLNKNRAAGIDYSVDRLYAGLVYQSEQTDGTTLGIRSIGATRSNTLALGASYRMDVAKLFGYAQTNHVSGQPNATGYMAGATVPVGQGEFRVSAMHTNRSNADASLFAVGYAYFLSKRTMLYTSAARLDNKGASRYAMWPSSQDVGAAGAPAAGQDVTGVQFGMRHLF